MTLCSATNEKLKHDAHAQVVDAVQAISVLYMTQVEAIRPQIPRL